MFRVACGFIAVAACSKTPEARIVASDLWPGAPAEVAPTGPHLLAYRAAAFGEQRFRMSLTAAHKQTNFVSESSGVSHVVPTSTPNVLDVILDEIDVKTGENRETKFDHDRLTYNGKTYARDDPDRPIHFEDMVDRATSRLTVTATAVTRTSTLDAGDQANLGTSTTNQFRQLPKTPIAIGATWSEALPLAFPGVGEFALQFDYRYVADTRCPNRPKALCVRIDMRATTPVGNLPDGAVLYGSLVGRYYFDVEAGSIDELRERIAFNFDSRGETLELDGSSTVVFVNGGGSQARSTARSGAVRSLPR